MIQLKLMENSGKQWKIVEINGKWCKSVEIKRKNDDIVQKGIKTSIYKFIFNLWQDFCKKER